MIIMLKELKAELEVQFQLSMEQKVSVSICIKQSIQWLITLTDNVGKCL